MTQDVGHRPLLGRRALERIVGEALDEGAQARLLVGRSAEGRLWLVRSSVESLSAGQLWGL